MGTAYAGAIGKSMGATAASAKAVKQKRKKSVKHRPPPLEKSHLEKELLSPKQPIWGR